MEDRFKEVSISFELELIGEEGKALNDSKFIGTLEIDERYYDLIMEAGFAWNRKYAWLNVKPDEVDKYKALSLQFIKEAVDNFEEEDDDDLPF